LLYDWEKKVSVGNVAAVYGASLLPWLQAMGQLADPVFLPI
jgi:hypothetical protein